MNNDILSLPSIVSPKNENDGRISFRQEYKNLNYDYGIEQVDEMNIGIPLLREDMSTKITTGRNTKLTSKLTTAKNSIEVPPEDGELLNKISELEETITQISNELYITQTVNRGDDYVRAEIDLWKNKMDYLTNYHNRHIAEIEDGIYTQECEFKDEIQNIQENNKMILYNLDMAYKSLMKKTNNEINELKREKEELVYKTENIKKVFNLK
jgi:hypothetical protein